ncbi:MAG: KOW motif-containing protein, partial [Bacteroidales bacterium]|nr:KOW motif-containing protein [Bacteroidales bacterium]
MALGTNIKYQLQTVFETAFDEKSAKQVERMYDQMAKRAADSTREEFVSAFQNFGHILNNALKKLNIQPIDISKMVELPNAQMFSQLGSEFGTRFAEGFNGAVSSGNGVSDVIQKQIKDLEAQRESLLKRQKTLPKRLEHYEKLADAPYMERDEFHAFSKEELSKRGSDITQVAKTMLNELDVSQSHLSSLQKGTQEFNKALLDFYTRAYDVFRMSRTLSKSPELVSDKSVLQSYDFDALQEIYNGESKHSFGAYDKYFAQFIEKQQSLLDGIPIRIEKINQELINLQQNSGNVIPIQEVETGLKSLNEIEAAYKRILNAKGKVGVRGRNIEGALNFDPSTSKEGIKKFYENYTNLSSDSPWEVEYQALLKYVKLYESYLNSDNESHRKKAQNPEFKTLYEQLKPMAANAENMLRNVLNMANDIPLVGMGGADADSRGVDNTGVGITSEEVENMGVEKVRMASMDVNVGDHVSVKSGPLEGFSGLVESVDEKRRKVIVRVAMFGKETPAEVDYS